MMYVDDYCMIDTAYIIHACLVNPCPDHPDDHPWLIGLLLGIGTKRERCTLAYPTRALRDQAFEQLGALVRAEQALPDEV
ncbi:MAG TPA: hypothetical protein VF077_12325 [Nitrospiraceae bacterium]